MPARSIVVSVALVIAGAGAGAVSPETVVDTDTARLNEAMLAADIIVIATIDAVAKKNVEWATSEGQPRTGESGHAELAAVETLWSTLPEKPSVRINWNYIDSLDPAESRNPHRNGETAIYFLACPSGSNDPESQGARCSADGAEMNEQFHVSLDARESVTARLSEFPVRVAGPPSYRAGGSVPVTITLANYGRAPLELPAIAYDAGRLVHGSGMTFAVLKGSRTGPEALLRIGRIRTDASLEPRTFDAGGSVSIEIDLQKLYGLTEPGYFVLEIGLAGRPAQRPFLFRLD